MPLHKLQVDRHDGGDSAKVTLPKTDLRRDGLVDKDGRVEEVPVAVDRVGDGEYRLQLNPGESTPKATKEGV